jgi:hypothetical protein
MMDDPFLPLLGGSPHYVGIGFKSQFFVDFCAWGGAFFFLG